MKKKVLCTIFLCIIISLLLLVVDFLTIRTDNSTSLSEAITVKYPVSTIDALKEESYQRDVYFYELKAKFNLQCIRKTEREFYKYYVVLKQEDDRYAFLFIGRDLKVGHIMTYDRIKSKSEFDFIVVDQTTKGEVEAVDDNPLLSSISSSDFNMYILQEGLLAVDIRFTPVEKYNDPTYSSEQNTVQNLLWFPDDQLQNPDLSPYSPNILPQDKQELR